ncbi:sialidase family protein [Hyphococcus luteus]|uniref:Sialidase domain-containing protein n=1 Tax=Hyphococcus luteus TaxID=2058213 RepID=A0A2S7K1G3_9PROT|nr:sialidase family protein [Marinicaulis flavus]PQA86350.1 hypothetical protein CW354_18600 [Marinicaulis flavus]
MIQRRNVLISGLVGGALATTSAAARKPALIREYKAPRPAKDVDHSVVYRREDEFCSWPYTMGFWETGDGDFLQSFLSLTVVYNDPDNINHDNLASRATDRRMITVRSKDRGRTWNGDEPIINMLDRGNDGGTGSLEGLGPVDYLDKNVLISNFGQNFGKPDARTYVQISKNSGETWSPKSFLPLDGLSSLTGLNSSLVRPDGRCLLFLFESAEDGWNRRPLVYGSLDGGTEFRFMSFITAQHDPKAQASGDWKTSHAFGGHRWFYPRASMLPNGRILCTLRSQRDPRGTMWTEVYKSDDGGRTWGFLSRVNDWGAPGSLVVMEDGRLVIVYGYRLPPFGIRAVVSEDGGKTWGGEIIIRDDGGSWDVGYPNAFEVEPGKIGAIYYFNSKDDPMQVVGGSKGGVRHIARSIFKV